MKKCLIICWYGKLPEYYKIWEQTCKNNKDYDFLIFTDQFIKNEVENIKVVNISFEDIKKLIEKKLNIKVNFFKPYKLCDFRPAYGIIFEDYLIEYNYWGHCDLDIVFANISNFISDETIEKYEKINHNGHFALYKNNEKINNLFRKKGSIFDWIEVYTNKDNYAFDEYTGINMIVQKNNILEYSINKFADIDRRYKRYKTKNHPNWSKQIFVLEDGKIYRYVYEKKQIMKKDSFFYLHFQKKKLLIEKELDYTKKIIIGSRKIGNILQITEETFEIFNPSSTKVSEILEVVKYYLYKIKEFLKSTKKEKIIKLKQKGVL